MKKLLVLLLATLTWCGVPARLLACAVVTGLQASTLGGTTVAVQFTPASGIRLYAVQLFAGSTRVATNYEPYGRTIFHLLQPATTYTVRVGSVCSPGDTTYAAPVAITTDAGAALCPYVTGVCLGQVAGTQATVGFTAVSGATGYQLLYYSLADTANRQTMTVTSPPAVLTNLLPNTPYRVRISTICGSVLGLTSAPFVLQTTAGAVCSSASNVVVTATGSTTATVSFTAGVGNGSFRLLYRAAGDSTRYFTSSASSPILLTGLQPGQLYYFQLQSQCGGTSIYTTGSTFPYGFRSGATLASQARLGASAVEAYPNPAQRVVAVRVPAVPGAASVRLTLLDALGRPVRTRDATLPPSGTQAELSLADLAPGLYVLRVAAGGATATLRLVVE